MTSPERRRSSRRITFALLLPGLFFTLLIFAVLALGECLPRDESASMQACDTAKRREFFLYPLLVLCVIVGAVRVDRRIPGLGMVLVLTSGIVAAVLLTIVDGVIALSG